MNPRAPFFRLLLTAAALFVGLAGAPAASALCNDPIFDCTAAMGCNPTVEGLISAEPTRIEIQFHDQCDQEQYSTLFYHRGTSGRFVPLSDFGVDSGGWRSTVHSGLTPGETYCYRARTYKDNVFRYSEIKCVETPTYCPKPVIGWAEGGVAPFAEAGAGSVTVQYHDQCGQEDSTKVYHRLPSGLWELIKTDPYDSTGWRTATKDGLKPGESYCFFVKTKKFGETQVSDTGCTETTDFTPLDFKAFEVDDVGSSFSSYGYRFRPAETRRYRISATRLTGDGKPRVAVADVAGNLIAYRQGYVETYLSAAKEYRVYLTGVAAQNGVASSCELEVDRAPVHTTGCSWQAAALLDVRTQVQLEAVHLPPERFLPDPVAFPGGEPPAIRMVYLPSSGSTSLSVITGNGIAGGARLTPDKSSVSGVVLLAYDGTAPLAQPIRLVRNDVQKTGHDADGDGLGDDLEYAIGTCWQKSGQNLGFDCGEVFDPRDTDGDGISDLWELLGREAPAGLDGADQPLPYWGASPRHKDLFLEVDFGQTLPVQTPLQVTAKAAELARAIWGFETASHPGRLQLNAEDLANPDGKPGIALHVDSGLPASTVEGWTTAGDWGGYDAFPAQWDAASGSWKRVEQNQIWDTAMQETRYGIYRHALGTPGNGGSAGWGPTAGFGIGGSDDRTADLLSHEVGHSFGLDHGGPFQMHVHVVPGYDPEAGGANTCKPFYISIMNYAYERVPDPPQYGFADDYVINFAPMNQLALVESNALGHYLGHAPQEARDLAVLELAITFRLAVDPTTGDVDWNRDGIISSTPVRAGVSFTGKDCDQGRWNSHWLSGGPKTTTSLAAEAFESSVRYAWSEGGMARIGAVDFDRDCPTTDGGDCVREITPKPLPALAADSGVDLERIETATSTGVKQRLVLVALDRANNTIAVTERFGGYPWSPVTVLPSILPNGTTIFLDGEPELVRLGPEDPSAVAKLIFKAVDQKVYLRTVSVVNDVLLYGPIEPLLYDPDDGSSPAQMVLDSPISSPAALTIVPHDLEPALIGPGTAKVAHLFVPASSNLQISRLTSRGGNVFRHAQTVATSLIRGKVAPVWVNLTDEDADRGLLSVYYTPMGPGGLTGPPAAVRVVRTINKALFDAEGNLISEFVTEDWGLFDARAIAGNVAVTFQRGQDYQPQMLLARADRGDSLIYRPRTDNVRDFNFHGYNDWLTLRYTLCHHIATAFGRVQELGGDPIDCRPFPEVDETLFRW